MLQSCTTLKIKLQGRAPTLLTNDRHHNSLSTSPTISYAGGTGVICYCTLWPLRASQAARHTRPAGTAAPGQFGRTGTKERAGRWHVGVGSFLYLQNTCKTHPAHRDILAFACFAGAVGKYVQNTCKGTCTADLCFGWRGRSTCAARAQEGVFTSQVKSRPKPPPYNSKRAATGPCWTACVARNTQPTGRVLLLRARNTATARYLEVDNATLACKHAALKATTDTLAHFKSMASMAWHTRAQLSFNCAVHQQASRQASLCVQHTAGPGEEAHFYQLSGVAGRET